MNITVVGAGNVGTQFAVHCAQKGHEVTIYGSRPNEIKRELIIVDESYAIIHRGIIKRATNEPFVAFRNVDMIFIIVPAPLMQSVVKKIEPYITAGLKIGIVPGIGGWECAFKECINRGAVLFGLQRVPSVSRLLEYGKKVCAVGYRKELFVGSLPNRWAGKCAEVVESIFDIKTNVLPNYLNVTLTPSNPILHTTRLKNLYGDYQKDVVYKNVPLFYEEWNDETSVQLLKCDDEVQEICRNLSAFDLSHVKSLRVHYNSYTAEEMTRKIAHISGFKGLASPTLTVADGYIPDFKSRYFTSDFPYGLAILVQIANLIKVEVPSMSEILAWFSNIFVGQEMFCFSNYGIRDIDDFTKFYSQ